MKKNIRFTFFTIIIITIIFTNITHAFENKTYTINKYHLNDLSESGVVSELHQQKTVSKYVAFDQIESYFNQTSIERTVYICSDGLNSFWISAGDNLGTFEIQSPNGNIYGCGPAGQID